MRKSTIVRAVVATTALALVLPVGPAQADEKTDGGQPLGGQPLVTKSATLESGPRIAPAGSLSESRSSAAAAASVIGTFSISSGAIHTPKGNFIPGKVTVTRDDVSAIVSRISYSGKRKGTVELRPNGFYIPAKFGAGLAQLGPNTVTLRNGSKVTDAKKSNQFRVRYGLHPKTRIKIERRGSKLTFKSRDVRYYKINRYTPVTTAYVQVLTSNGWRTLKAIHPNREGSSTFSIRHSGKRHYRLAVKTTTKLKGGATKAIKI